MFFRSSLKNHNFVFFPFMFNIHDLQYWAKVLRQFCSPALDRDSIIKSSAYKRELNLGPLGRISVEQLNTSQLATPCWRDTTRSKQQFGLYRVVAPLSFLRSISVAPLFISLSIFGWSDLLQILCRQAAFSFAVLYIISTIPHLPPQYVSESLYIFLTFLLSGKV